MRGKRMVLMGSAVVLVLAAGSAAFLLQLPRAPMEAVERDCAGTEFAVSSPLREIDMGEGRTLCLYWNQDGAMDGAVTHETLGSHRVVSTHGHLFPRDDVRVLMQMSAVEQGDHYIVFGWIQDEAVDRVVYGGRTLPQFEAAGTRYFYEFGPGEIPETNYTLYDAQGNELPHQYPEEEQSAS